MMCRTIRPKGGGSARLADPKGATERRLDGNETAMSKSRVPLYCSGGYSHCVQKSTANCWGKICARRVKTPMSFCLQIMSLRDTPGQVATYGPGPGLVQNRKKTTTLR